MYVKKFNETIMTFLKELQGILPEEKEIATFRGQVGAMIMVNEKKLVKSFMGYAKPFKIEIMEKNEDFFLGHEDIPHDYMSESLHIKELWRKKLSYENKEVIWKYFQVLYVLAEKCE